MNCIYDTKALELSREVMALFFEPMPGAQLQAKIQNLFIDAMRFAAPDGWIPVSERMPDKLIPVMVMYEDGDMWSAIWSGQFWDDGYAIPDQHSITHWRGMPDAPKVTP